MGSKCLQENSNTIVILEKRRVNAISKNIVFDQISYSVHLFIIVSSLTVTLISYINRDSDTLFENAKPIKF